MTGEKRGLLVVDDDKDMCKTLKGIFNKEEYDTEVAYDWNGAISWVEKKAFDIALIDMVMEEPNGMTVLKKVKEQRPDTICFMITAYPSEHRIKEALASGALKVFTKPLNIEEIIENIDKEMAKRKGGKDG